MDLDEKGLLMILKWNRSDDERDEGNLGRKVRKWESGQHWEC